MRRARLATVWLDGCSGCHMSLLDMDEVIINIAKRVEVVYGPEMFATIRTLRIADGPDEVHRALIAKLELKKYKPKSGASA